MKTKLAIAICHTGSIKGHTFNSVVAMIKDLPFDYYVLTHEGSMLHLMRERLVQRAIELKCTHLLFVDSDMAFNPDAVLKLLKRKKAVIGAPYNRRQLPLTTTMVNPKDLKAKLTEVEAVGTGFLLIDLKVFKDLEAPWFFWGEGTGEDYWFCDKARKAGHKIWADLTVPIKHVGDYQY